MTRSISVMVIAASLLAGNVALGQSESATLTGIVTDLSGGVLIDVGVTATNQATSLSVSTTTNESGRYVLQSLKPGVYMVSMTFPGFKKHVNSTITLQVNQTARLDVRMQVGEVSDQITVTGGAPLLEPETSNRGALIDGRKIIELPLNGRDYNQLALLSPGVLAPTPRLQSIGFRGAFNANGNRAFQNAFLLDGVDNTSYSNSYRGNNMQVVQPSVEALQEFKIQTNAYAAEFGRSSGALINAVIKSGSNNLHGSAYEFHRNDNLDATNFFANKNGLAEPFRLRNQFGGSVGGPLIRNRTFFFGDYEGLRDRTGRVLTSSAPQPAWTRGRFTIPIANPFNLNDSGQDFQQPATPDCNDGRGNCWVIPPSYLDPVGQRIVAVIPEPNAGAPGQFDNNFVNAPITSNRTDQFDLRVDHSFSNLLTVFGRYSFADTKLFNPAPRPGLAEGSTNDTFGAALLRSQGLAAGATWVFSPRIISELRFGLARGNFFQTPPNFGSGCPEKLIGLKGSPADESICGGLPPINFPGARERRIGRTTSVPQFQTPRSYNVRDAVSWTRANHTFKFGGELLKLQTGIRDVSALLGSFTFSGRFSGQNGQYQGGVADLLMGLPTRYQQDSNTVFNVFQNLYSAYAQDDWKVHPRLTLNLGVRYEFATPPRERDLRWANFDPAARAFVEARDGSLFAESLIHPDRNNFAPRAGFAWSPLSRTVVRGAYGVFYNHTSRMGREGLLGFNLPFMVLADTPVPSGSGMLKAQQAPFRLQDGVPAGFVDIKRVNQATVARKAQDPNQRTTYVQQWNFGLQRELAGDLLLDVAYVGNRGAKLAAFRNLNQLAVSFNASTGAPVAGPRPLADVGLNGNIQMLENLGISNYHSLQTRLEKRFSGGLSALVSYTWGKALTNSVDHLSTSALTNGVDVGVYKEPQNPLDRRSEYGPAEFDVAHRFVASAVWELPIGNRRSGVGRLLDGWQLSPIVTTQTGLGLTVTQAELLNLGDERRSRPNRLGNGSLPSGHRTVDRYLDASAFSILTIAPGSAGFVPNQAFGNSGVGILRAPGFFNVDFNLSKDFPLSENHAVQFRAEIFNALNRANFGVPGVQLGSGFGQITQTSTEARIVQFAIKYRF